VVVRENSVKEFSGGIFLKSPIGARIKSADFFPLICTISRARDCSSLIVSFLVWVRYSGQEGVCGF
jgi:hypothetical protein